MGTLRFELRADKADADGKQPIELIYHVKGFRTRYRTKEKVFPVNWDHENQTAIYINRDAAKKLIPAIPFTDLPASRDIDSTNHELSKLESAIKDIEKMAELRGIALSSREVITELINIKRLVPKEPEPANRVLDFIDSYIERNTETRKKGSLTVYRVLKNHLDNFNEKITFSNIDYNFFERFQNFLLKEKIKVTPKGKKKKYHLNNITVAKQLSTLKTLLGYASKSGIDVNKKYKDFTIIKRDADLEVIALTQSEFDQLYTLKIKKPEWDRVRDAFCLSCLTGLRYSDLKQLKPVHIKDHFIDLTGVKTTFKVKIPLLPEARTVLKKYNNQLPVISNQKMNEHLKKIFEWNGIAMHKEEIVRHFGSKTVKTEIEKYKLISVHCGRKTFATLSLQKGMSAEVVMKIGGWKSYASFKRYVNVTDDHAQKAMLAAYSNPSAKMKAVS